VNADRRRELASNLERFEERLVNACGAAGRDRTEVTLIAVTKTFPADDARHLVELGITDLGESRDQEASAKAAELTDLDLTWHFVGQLQSNKCPSIARYADAVHSLDRARIVDALSNAAHDAERMIEVLLQVSLDDDPNRGGARRDELAGLAEQVAGSANLRLGGVMAVAPLGGDAASAFHVLSEVAAEVRSVHPDATFISAGMSADLEQAIAAGATHVRIGTALLGGRLPRVR
jgi:pyridoxal phosphate enzyme (YggS family)